MEKLVLRAETEINDEADKDAELMALSDEFSDAIAANISSGFAGNFRMCPIERI
jgi:hypothetical protein